MCNTFTDIFNLPNNPVRWILDVHVKKEETDAQRGGETCLRSPSHIAVGMGCVSGCLTLDSTFLNTLLQVVVHSCGANGHKKPKDHWMTCKMVCGSIWKMCSIKVTVFVLF